MSNFIQSILQSIKNNPQRILSEDWAGGKKREYAACDFLELVTKATAFFKYQSLKKGAHIVHVAQNSTQWVALDTAMFTQGIISAPLYAKLPLEQILIILAAYDTDAIITDNPELNAELKAFGYQVFTYNDVFNHNHFADLEFVAEENNLATVVFTSGTTGEPKGAMITLANLDFTVKAGANLLGQSDGIYGHVNQIFHFLPFNFMASRLLLYVVIFSQAKLCISADPSTFKEDLVASNPDCFFCVPLILQRVKSKIEAGIAQKPSWIARLINYALNNDMSQSWFKVLSYRILKKLIFNKIKNKLATNLKFIISGSASLDAELQTWFERLGIPIYQAYGTTECAGMALSDQLGDCQRIGKTGKVLPGSQIRISEQGELWIKGPHVFIGYLNSPEKTNEVLQDGWLKTGDLASQDDEGRIKISGRKNDMMVLLSGHNVHPDAVEMKLREHFDQVTVFSEDKLKLSAFVVTNQNETQILDKVFLYNKKHPHFYGISTLYITEHALTLESGLLTANQKIRRHLLIDQVLAGKLPSKKVMLKKHIKHQARTIIDVFLNHVNVQPDASACIYLNAKLEEQRKLTYHDMFVQMNGIGSEILKRTEKGDRVIIMMPNCTEYLCAFLACLYTGRIAVPLCPPISKDECVKIKHVIKDSRASLLLSTPNLLKKIRLLNRLKPIFQNINAFKVLNGNNPKIELLKHWEKIKIPTMAIRTKKYNKSVEIEVPILKPDDTAFLQYTSGSTGKSRGVMVTHANIMANESIITAIRGVTGGTICVSWLPLHHDMGLIGCFLNPLYTGGLTVLLSPTDFLHDPLLWLRALSRYRANCSAAPNFGYQLCVSRFSEQSLQGIDLSAWRCAIVGAEPIRWQVLQNFYEYFSPYGFEKTSFTPSYGLAESTLLVSAKSAGTAANIHFFDNVQLEKGVAQASAKGLALVSSGCVQPGFTLKIVDPKHGQTVADGRVGEIWLSGGSVTAGYWHQNDKHFNAKLRDDPSHEYLKTGDLGFIYENELYIQGRLKDLIIMNGRNIYPQDLELSVESLSNKIRSGRVVAFSIDKDDQERIVIIAECYPMSSKKYIDLQLLIQREISKAYAAPVYKVLLVSPKTLALTTSGKVRRILSKQTYIINGFKNLAEEAAQTSSQINGDTLYQEINTTVVEYLREHCAVVGKDQGRLSLLELGIDSIQLVTFCTYLEKKYSIPILMDIVNSSLNLDSVISLLYEQVKKGKQQKTHVASTKNNYANYVEHYAGTIELPVGLAGPLYFNSENIKEQLIAPMATSELALVASVCRGCKAINAVGGVNTLVRKEILMRAPVFVFKDPQNCPIFANWIKSIQSDLTSCVAQASSHAILVKVETVIIMQAVHLQLYYYTAEAAGQNMITHCSAVICEWLLSKFKQQHPTVDLEYFIEGGFSSDKKASKQNLIVGRGVWAEARLVLPYSVLRNNLACDPHSLKQLYEISLNATSQMGLLGFNINVANVLAGLFLATGQDAACIHESSVADLSITFNDEQQLSIWHLQLPALVIGTVGGGTSLPLQNHYIKQLGCGNEGGKNRLAQIIAGFCLALEISTSTAIVNGHFHLAHEQLGYHRIH